MSDDQGQSWYGLGHCDFGYLYTGAVMGAVELQSGRLLVPISYYSQRPTGKHVSLVSMSDDGGLTWRPSGGECVVDTGGHLMEGGAIEPVLLLVMGVVIAGLLVSLYLPLFQLGAIV